jgi:hypothetical protein
VFGHLLETTPELIYSEAAAGSPRLSWALLRVRAAPQCSAAVADRTRFVGVEHCILSSDMGQPANPLHPDALAAFFKGMREQGFSQSEIDQMSKTNPARLLGLDE